MEVCFRDAGGFASRGIAEKRKITMGAKTQRGHVLYITNNYSVYSVSAFGGAGIDERSFAISMLSFVTISFRAEI